MIGTQLDQRYQVIQALSQGGFGHTYLARDTRRPGQPICVVKHLKPATNDPGFLATARRLFNSEAETLEKLGAHDRIPRLLAYFEQGEEFFLVEEYIAGHPLSAELQGGQRWSEAQVIEVLQEVLSILDFVHGNGVIHRDIKPDNIIRREGDRKLVLVDFGAVKQVKMQAIAVSEMLANETVAIGTPGYMPSEQGQGRPRPNSDLYALGTIAIQGLTGLNPTQLAEDPETGELIWREYAQTSDLLAAVLSQMVRHYFAHRYQSAAEVLQALEPLTQPYTPKAMAVALSQMGRYYLRRGYRFALKTARSLTAHSRPEQPASPRPSTPPEIPSAQNTVTVMPVRSRPSPAKLAPVQTFEWVPSQKLPLFLGLGTIALGVAIASTFALRQPSPSPQTTEKPEATATENSSSPPPKPCVVVVSPSNLRAGAGGKKTGKVIPAGTQVTATGQEEGGWLEISAPESGWIYKNRTKSCPSAGQ